MKRFNLIEKTMTPSKSGYSFSCSPKFSKHNLYNTIQRFIYRINFCVSLEIRIMYVTKKFHFKKMTSSYRFIFSRFSDFSGFRIFNRWFYFIFMHIFWFLSVKIVDGSFIPSRWRILKTPKKKQCSNGTKNYNMNKINWKYFLSLCLWDVTRRKYVLIFFVCLILTLYNT